MTDIIEAGRLVYDEVLNIVVWVKSNAGQGSFYRSKHEFIIVFRVGKGPHLNNIELGRHGRSRSNVWNYAGVNAFRAGRMEELRSHPTAKPVALIADAMRDCTRRGDVVLDTFSGSGTTIMAAERIGRRAYAMEIEPRYVDLAIRRWQAFTRKDAVHAETGRTFDQLTAERPSLLTIREAASLVSADRVRGSWCLSGTDRYLAQANSRWPATLLRIEKLRAALPLVHNPMRWPRSTKSDRAVRRKSFNSSRARVEIRRAPSPNRHQLGRISSRCSSEHSAQK